VRRATAALLGTVTGTVLLVGLKYGTGSVGHANVDSSTTLAEPSGGASDPGVAGSAEPTGAPGGASTGAPAISGVPSAPPATRAAPGHSAAPSKAASAGPPPPPATPACTTVAGDPSNVSRPGIGAVTVTIKVCGGTISTASGALSQSNWSRNTNAIPALNTMAVQYYKTNFAQIHYSGATLTSNAYQASLRSAMTRAKL
jgi:hypothetical protein